MTSRYHQAGALLRRHDAAQLDGKITALATDIRSFTANMLARLFAPTVIISTAGPIRVDPSSYAPTAHHIAACLYAEAAIAAHRSRPLIPTHEA